MTEKKAHIVTLSIEKELEGAILACGGMGSLLGKICKELLKSHPLVVKNLVMTPMPPLCREADNKIGIGNRKNK